MYHIWQSYNVWFLRYGAWQTEVFVILDHFFPFYLLNNLKNKNLKKWKKRLEISSFYNSVPKIMIICYTVPEMWCVIDVVFYFSLWAIFCPFYSPNKPKNQNFKKMKYTPGDMIILYKCTKNYDRMMYGSWDTVRDGRMGRWTDGQTDGKSDK